ncbi:hypothetical protein Calhy_1789 [Caldicellulosiruptor hydrothermalis 108]|uniref:Uncharacterized protein n=1 Tax=Caldicellulosiruptor hydrothermalis (strain DSM 18901 / VKM B-2411 / 108) TaxID=632292 RepID=E4QD08_CALH1|nr:hypothetical protein Calhy_1789 [Caldicellulosiruptor hydrothermalis 108]
MSRRILVNIAICILPLVNEIVYMQIGLYTRKYKKENIYFNFEKFQLVSASTFHGRP